MDWNYWNLIFSLTTIQIYTPDQKVAEMHVKPVCQRPEEDEALQEAANIVPAACSIVRSRTLCGKNKKNKLKKKKLFK